MFDPGRPIIKIKINLDTSTKIGLPNLGWRVARKLGLPTCLRLRHSLPGDYFTQTCSNFHIAFVEAFVSTIPRSIRDLVGPLPLLCFWEVQCICKGKKLLAHRFIVAPTGRRASAPPFS
ncbi:hypothetical protein Ndes2437A_g03050 [Nannochloris sp. 'desiccata']